ncbi:flagellar hook protein FlgE [Diaphorobacter sp. DS2]|nr:flagellar hook protein FlgE [Diaphorobacter sp. DS2]
MSFQQGLSGLNAASKNLDVIGHNIANSNTVGFKASRAEFAEMVASAIGSAGGSSAGIGVETANVAQQFTQGNLNITGNNLDVAINGNGFFMLKLPDQTQAYTRAGNFKLDNVGNMVTNDGAQILGYTVNPVTGERSNEPVPMVFPTSEPIPAKKTQNIVLGMNLDATAVGDLKATPPVQPAPRSTYGTSINVFDTQGVATPVNLYFQKNGSNSWEIYDKLNDKNAVPPVIGRFVGKIEMDGNGNIIGMTQPTGELDSNGNYLKGTRTTRKADGTFEESAVTWEWKEVKDTSVTPNKTIDWVVKTETITVNPTAPTTFEFKLNLKVDPSKANPNNPPTKFDVKLDLSKTTQFGAKFAVSELTQDGYASGDLTGINIENNGMIMTRYSNGVTRAEGQLALANFRNTQGLAAIGGNNWVETFESGQPNKGTATDRNFGSLRSGALEESNVDLTAELVNMMTAQRAYQANAQTIKTQDQVMSTLVNLR